MCQAKTQISLRIHAFSIVKYTIFFFLRRKAKNCDQILSSGGQRRIRQNCVDAQADITTPRLYNFDPLIPHVYIVKQGFTGVYIIFLILLKNIDCGYLLESPLRGGFNE